MIKTFMYTRRYEKETYSFYKVEPEEPGEKGILGLEVKPYALCVTPENAFGYTDTITLCRYRKYDNNGIFIGYVKRAVPNTRYVAKWILKKIEKQLLKIESEI